MKLFILIFAVSVHASEFDFKDLCIGRNTIYKVEQDKKDTEVFHHICYERGGFEKNKPLRTWSIKNGRMIKQIDEKNTHDFVYSKDDKLLKVSQKNGKDIVSLQYKDNGELDQSLNCNFTSPEKTIVKCDDGHYKIVEEVLHEDAFRYLERVSSNEKSELCEKEGQRPLINSEKEFVECYDKKRRIKKYSFKDNKLSNVTEFTYTGYPHMTFEYYFNGKELKHIVIENQMKKSTGQIPENFGGENNCKDHNPTQTVTCLGHLYEYVGMLSSDDIANLQRKAIPIATPKTKGLRIVPPSVIKGN